MVKAKQSRRAFVTDVAKGLGAAAVASGFPAIVPSTVFGAGAPSNRINIGAIGAGRISRGHDLPGLWKHPEARIMAVCDLDSNRVQDAITLINGQYAQDDRQALRRRDRLLALSRAARQQGRRRRRDQHAGSLARAHRHRRRRAGKDVYLQKPASLTIAEGRALSDAVHRSPAHLPDRQPAAVLARSSATRPNWCATAASDG